MDESGFRSSDPNMHTASSGTPVLTDANMDKSSSGTPVQTDVNMDKSSSGDPVPPDGGWGYVVALTSFILQGLTSGMIYIFGILLVALLEEFGETEATTSIIGSIQPALITFTGTVKPVMSDP